MNNGVYNSLLKQGLLNSEAPSYAELQEDRPPLTRTAYCSSVYCAGRKSTSKKGVLKYTTTNKCPDCGHELFFETKRVEDDKQSQSESPSL